MKDYARQSRSPSQNIPTEIQPVFRWSKKWAVIAGSVVLVLGLGTLGYFKILHKPKVVIEKSTEIKKNKSKATGGRSSVAKVPEILEKPQFEFYDILPERDTVVAASKAPKSLPPPPLPLPTPTAAGNTVVSSPVPTPTPSPSPVAPTVASPKKQFMIQVASYQEKPQAQKVVQRLRQAQIQARLILTASGWWRVDVGPVESRREAEALRQNIQAQGIVGSLIREIQRSEK